MGPGAAGGTGVPDWAADAGRRVHTVGRSPILACPDAGYAAPVAANAEATPTPIAASDAKVERLPKPVARQVVSRLAGVDGLRAAAALWVVLFHIRVFSGARLPVQPVDFFARSGSTGVSLFLVISGFCLYLPFAAGKSGRFKTGGFLVRRARRLLPAYYVSIALALALNLIGGPRLGFPSFTPGQAGWQVFSHVTMLHTFFASSFYALNGAYWSLGLEWELYLALPLLIIGARRFGLVPTLACAVLVNVVYRLGLAWAASRGLLPSGVVQTVVLPNLLPGRWAEFVFGMVAAELFSRGWLERLPGFVTYLWAPMLVVAVVTVSLPISHLSFGILFALLLIAALAHGNPVHRIFAWRPLVALGIMSYSLYLVHQPLIQAGGYVLRRDVGLSPNYAFVALVMLLPVVIAVAWALFVLVERYTLTSRPVEIKGLAARILFPGWTPIEQPELAAATPRSGSGPDTGIRARSG
jgi:peptidoglycan/LPS O-acetylase OafA/YrhL